MVKQPTVISTFAGCGGSSLGYKWAGYRELLATDFDDDSVKVFKANFPDVPMLQADICQVTAAQVLEFAGLKPGELDVFDGSPPCQGFSTAGRRQVRDERNDLFKEYVRLIREIRPRAFVMENVKGMAIGRMKGRFLEILGTLRTLDYRVRCRVMNSRYYGVPQSRNRLIFIGVRKDLGLEPVFPEPEKHVVTVRKAFEGLPPQTEDRPMPDWMRRACRKITPGMGVWKIATVFIAEKGSAAGSIATSRLCWGRPCPTIVKSEFGHAGLIHPDEDRYLTTAELKRLASFPDDFKFTNRRLACERIGNAVMPRFMYHIAKTVRERILETAQDGPRTSQVTKGQGGPCPGKGKAGKRARGVKR